MEIELTSGTDSISVNQLLAPYCEESYANVSCKSLPGDEYYAHDVREFVEVKLEENADSGDPHITASSNKSSMDISNSTLTYKIEDIEITDNSEESSLSNVKSVNQLSEKEGAANTCNRRVTKGKHKRAFPCPSCSYSSSKFDNLQTHIEVVHRNLKPFKCDMCNYSCGRQKDLNRHTDSVHYGKRDFQCPHCSYASYDRIYLKRHIATKHDMEKKPLTCPHPDCGYSATQQNNLESHLLTHTGDNPYQCLHCDYRTSHSGHMRTHVMSRHTGEKPHACPHCDYKTSHSPHLKKHIASIHSKLKPYKCQQCDYSTSHTSHLKNHVMSKHTGEKPFSCPHCGYRATQKSTIKTHVISKHLLDKKS